MSAKTEELVRNITETIVNVGKDKTVPYDTSATIERVDGDTAWVNIPGGNFSTPVKLTVNAKAGDQVQVRVSGGTAFIIGNATSPPTDDTRAEEAAQAANNAITYAQAAQSAAEIAEESANKAIEDAAAAATAASNAQTSAYNASTAASNAQTSADNAATAASNAQTSATQASADAATAGRAASVAQAAAEAAQGDIDDLQEWFWHDTNGSHVLGATSGYRNDIDSTGMKIVETATEKSVAEFGVNGSVIGKNEETRAEFDYHSLKLIDNENNPYFYISDLRSKDGFAYLEEKFTGYGTIAILNLHEVPYGETTSDITHIRVTIDGEDVEFSRPGPREIRPSVDPPIGSEIVVYYKLLSDILKVYSLGKRKDGAYMGKHSVAEGYNIEASGAFSHAEGYSTTAKGESSHAEGSSTTASGSYSHAEGYNTNANGYYSHAEGWGTTTKDTSAHAEGSSTTASGSYSHAEGLGTIASGIGSHTEGFRTIAKRNYSHAMGMYNEENNDHIFAIGSGTSESNRGNLFDISTTGVISTYQKNNPFDSGVPTDPFFQIIEGNADLTSSKNVTSNKEHGLKTVDKNGYEMARFSALLETSGAVSARLVATNRTTAGTVYFNLLSVNVSKTGVLSYTVSSPGAFRSAIGITDTEVTTIASVIAVNSTNATISSVAASKYGKVVSLQIVWKNNNAITVPASGNITNVTVGTLTSAYRPKHAAAAHSHGDNAGAAWYNITTGGVLSLGACEGYGTASRTIAANSTFHTYATYIAAT